MIKERAETFVILSFVLLLLSLFIFVYLDKNIAPELAGQTEIETIYTIPVTDQAINSALKDFGNVELKYTDDKGRVVIGADELTKETYTTFLTALNSLGDNEIQTFETYSSVVASDLLRKSIIAILISSVVIILFISLTFRKVSKPVSSWKYGMVSIFALIHDIAIPVGFIVLAGNFFIDAKIDFLFITALLATLGYSINDTIVVFDRIREKLDIDAQQNLGKDFGDIVDSGVKASITRSVYTSLTTSFALLILFLFVPAIAWFSIVLFVGIMFGTYSSLFLAPSVLYLWHKYSPEKDKNTGEKTETEKAEDQLFENFKGVDTI